MILFQGWTLLFFPVDLVSLVPGSEYRRTGDGCSRCLIYQ